MLPGSGSNWTVTAIPLTNLLGATTISILATNQFGSSSKSFPLTLADSSDVTSNLPPAYSGTVNWVDCDNDGFLDLFISGYDTNYNAQTHLYHNNHDSSLRKLPPLSQIRTDTRNSLMNAKTKNHFPNYFSPRTLNA